MDLFMPAERVLYDRAYYLSDEAERDYAFEVAEEHVCAEALLERLTLEQGTLERVAEGADGVGEDVVEHDAASRGWR